MPATELYDRVNALLDQSRRLQHADPPQAVAVAEQALALASGRAAGSFSLDATLPPTDSAPPAEPYPEGIAESLLQLGVLHHDLSHIDQSLGLLLEALNRFEALHLPARLARTLIAITPIFGHAGDYAQALHYSLRALEAARRAQHPGFEAEANNDIGYTYIQTGQHAAALPYLEDGLAYQRQAGNQFSEVIVLDSLCRAYLGVGRLDDAQRSGEAAVALAETQNLPRRQAEFLISLSMVHQARGNLEYALACLHRGRRLAEQGGFTRERSVVQRHLGDIRRRQGALAEAQAHYEAGLDAAQSIALRPEIFRCHAALAELHKQAGDYQRALHHFEQFHAANEAVFNAGADARLRALQVAHQTEAARRAAELFQLRAQALEHEVQERRHIEAALREQATTDPLTGLATRRYFFDLAERALAHSRRYVRPLAVMMLDIDLLKQVNDTHGHAAGDRVIRAVAECLRRNLRQADVAGRYGGDEIAVVLPETTAIGGWQLAERLRAALAAERVSIRQTALPLSVSLGVSELHTTDQTIDSLLERADQAMYAVKDTRAHRPVRPPPA